MGRKGFPPIVAALWVCALAGPGWGAITVLSETYHVWGQALHYNSNEKLSYDLTSSTTPAFGELTQPFDDESFNDTGPYTLHASSRAARYREGRDVVFLVEQNPFDSSAGWPIYLQAEALTRADLAARFMVDGAQRQLHIAATADATPDGAILTSLTDLNTGESWSLIPYEWPGYFTGTVRMTFPVDPAHTYQLGLQAQSIEWVASSVLVRIDEFTVPTPNATALVAIGLIGIVTWRRHQREK